MADKNYRVKALLSFFTIVLFISFAFATVEGDDTPWNQRDNWSAAYLMTQNWVKDRLVSPSTAEFPGATTKRDHTTKLNGQRYKIESYVDSQNRMGGTIRTYFTAEVEQVSENEWRLISLNLE